MQVRFLPGLLDDQKQNSTTLNGKNRKLAFEFLQWKGVQAKLVLFLIHCTRFKRTHRHQPGWILQYLLSSSRCKGQNKLRLFCFWSTARGSKEHTGTSRGESCRGYLIIKTNNRRRIFLWWHHALNRLYIFCIIFHSRFTIWVPC